MTPSTTSRPAGSAAAPEPSPVPVCAVIADIVGSRRLEDRAAAQRTFLEVLENAGEGLDLLEPARATVGDEFQAVAPDLGAALDLTLRVSLLLPDKLRLRFGLGIGEVREVDPDAEDVVQDGSAWWAAREAINAAHDLQDSGRDFALTQLRVAGGADPAGSRESRPSDSDASQRSADGAPAVPTSPRSQDLTNAMLLLRDQAVSRLQARQRRVLGALLLGRTQVDVAREERLSQQAVSALARGAGAGILAAQELLGAVDGGASADRRRAPSDSDADAATDH